MYIDTQQLCWHGFRETHNLVKHWISEPINMDNKELARRNDFKATGIIQSLLSYQDNISKHNQYSNGGLKGTDKNEVYEIEKSTSSSF